MRENDQYNRDNDKTMHQDQYIAINQTVGVQRKRQFYLLNYPSHRIESAASFGYHTSRELPKNQPYRQHRQIIFDLGMEQLGVDEPHRPDHDGGRQGLPERAEHRAAIPQPHILMRQPDP